MKGEEEEEEEVLVKKIRHFTTIEREEEEETNAQRVCLPFHHLAIGVRVKKKERARGRWIESISSITVRMHAHTSAQVLWKCRAVGRSFG